MIELNDLARDAVWTSSRFSITNRRADETSLDWGGTPSDEVGFVNIWPSSRSESNQVSDYLVTATNRGQRGTVKGVFLAIEIPSQAEFRTEVGFLHGTPETGGAVFELRVHYQYEDQYLSHRVFSLYKERDGTLADVKVDLSFLGGRRARLELRVDAGPNAQSADLPIWHMPRVVVRETPLVTPTRFFQLRPIALTVNSRTERSGGGDDPYFGVLYFRTSLGVRGSTMVEVLDLLQNVGDNLDSGTRVEINDEAAMVVADIGLQSGDFATLMGTVFVAVEEDKFGRSHVRDSLRTAADRVALFLTREAENDPVGVLGDPEAFADALQRAAAGHDPNAPESAELPSAADILQATLTKIGGWFGRADDLIGINGVSIAVGPLSPIVISVSNSSTSRTFPLSELVNREYALDYEGDGGSWTLRVETQIVDPQPTLSGNPTLMEV